MRFLTYYARELTEMRRALAEHGRAARSDSGVPLAQQLWEMLALRAGHGKLSADDYYKLRVYRKEISFRDKRQYLSNQSMPRKLFGLWTVVADDKLLTYSILSDFGVAVPRVHAVSHDLREYRGSVTLKAAGDIAAYLRQHAPYPLIAKPIRGRFSRDVLLLDRYDPGSDTVLLGGDGASTPEALESRFLLERNGYLFQELLHPHRAIREYIGDRVCTLRVIIVLDRHQPRHLMTVWKINPGDNVADNYWREGNILARLDQDTGEVLQCMTGLGPKFRLVEKHPRTGKPLAGFQVPCYREAVDLTLHASKAFPGLRMQAWDIALTDSGPVPLELNVIGSLFIPQLVAQQGLWSGDFQQFVQSYRG